MRPAARVALVLALAHAPGAAEEELLQETRQRWGGLDRAGKLDALLRLSAQPSRALLAQCRTWVKDPDPVVSGQVVRLVTRHHALAARRASVRAFLESHVKQHLAARARREKREFEAVCREHGRRIPPTSEMAAGADWTDPYDERRRTLPAEIKAERAHVREVVAALESTKAPELFPALARIFREHHDPEVLVRAVRAFQALKEWRALPAMADLARIQRFGREMGGAMVIGRTEYETRRLKWDLHKDRLWWSRPEYVPRTVEPICEAASAITGRKIATVVELDAWLLANQAVLKARSVTLSAAFKKRAQSTQR
ncbi:MAG: hypothetical protein ACYS0K_00680 [Planctomycetota bacterium]